MQIFVKSLSSKTVTLDVESGDTIDHVKTLIAEKINAGVPVVEIGLMFTGKQLDGDGNLTEYHIQKADVPVEEMGLKFTGKKIDAGVPVEEMKLVFSGKQLKCHLTLADYNIQKESTLHMIACLDGGKGYLQHYRYTDPKLVTLAQNFHQHKMICRECYARLDARATKCRKKKCGRSTQLRPKSHLDSKGSKN